MGNSVKRWRNAKEFSKDVQLGKTYWVIREYHLAPDGVAWPYVFNKRQAFTGIPMCGSMSPTKLWNEWGPVYEERPTKSSGKLIPSIDEWKEYLNS